MSNFVLGSRSANSNVFHEMWQILREQDDLLNSLEAQCIITWIAKCKDQNEVTNSKMTWMMS